MIRAIGAACWRALGAPWRAANVLRDPEGRRGAALLFMALGGVAMTAYAAFALWIVRERPTLAFYLGVGALILIAIVLTGFAGLLIKRTIKGSFAGSSFEISDQHIAQAAAVGAATALAAQTPGSNQETGT